MPDSPPARPPVALIVGAAAFVVFVVVLLVQSLLPRRIETFVPERHVPRAPAPGRTDTVTLDVRDAATWQYLDLDDGRMLAPPDTQGWDLAARRFQLRLPERPAAASDDTRAALARWYKYDFLAHLLRPRGTVHTLRTDRDREIEFEVLGYYCPGPEAGCLTVRYTPATARASALRPVP